MKFMNKKEQVLDLQLTQYGKHLLSVGKLKPIYYAFFDDNILYDISYASGSEDQNDIEPRIQDNTPQLGTQYVFSGLETSFKRFYDEQFDIGTHAEWAGVDSTGEDIWVTDRGGDPNTNEMNRVQIPSTPEKLYSLSNPLGTTELYSDKAPAWNISFLDGEITSSSQVVSGSYQTQFIPQLNCDIIFETSLVLVSSIAPSQGEDLGFYASVVQNNELIGNKSVGGKFYKIEPAEILSQVLEENSDFDKENFEIEVFRKEEEEYIPMKFLDKSTNIVGDILVPPVETDMRSPTTTDPSYVEYYFDILVDDEISKSDICKSIQKLKSRGILVDDDIDCHDIMHAPVKFSIYNDFVSLSTCPTDDST